MQILNHTFTAAETAVVTPQQSLIHKASGAKPKSLTIEFNLTTPTSGTSIDAYVQMSFDSGKTWMDIANFHATNSAAKKVANLSALTAVTTLATPNDGALTANTTVDGFIGELIRVKYTSVGIYDGAPLVINVSPAY